MPNSKKNKYGYITASDFRDFRDGHWNDATEEIKEKWLFVALVLIPYVNPKWKKLDTKRTKLMTETITVSDEVIVQWYFHSYHDKWIRDYQETIELEANGGEKKKKKRSKQKGTEHISIKELGPYFKMMSDLVRVKEGDNEDILSWDNALRKHELQQMNKMIKQKENKDGEDGKENDDTGNAANRNKKTKEEKKWWHGVEGFNAGMIIYDKVAKSAI